MFVQSVVLPQGTAGVWELSAMNCALNLLTGTNKCEVILKEKSRYRVLERFLQATIGLLESSVV